MLFLQNLRERWREFSLTRAVRLAGAPKTDLRPDDLARLRQQMQDCLEARGGEVSARARAVELGRSYLQLSKKGRRTFLSVLANEFDIDHEAAGVAAELLLQASTGEERRAAEDVLRTALEPPRLKLLTQFNALPDGTKFLVDLREDVIGFVKRDPSLNPLEQNLKALLAAWFDIGFLELRRITWDSPASLLEKLARSEAVHTVTSWDDLKHRLDSDRRLFAFFHPRMPDEPLIFVEVALVRGLAGEIAPLLDKDAPPVDPSRADTAVFYSISNAQKGLAGISFGGFLIKRVVDELSGDFPRVRTFATLSPIPAFREWLEREMSEKPGRLLWPGERKAIAGVTAGDDSEGALRSLLDSDWHSRPDVAHAMKGPLMRLCAAYLLSAKRADGRAHDPVAHFHLRNGAKVERLNWLADRSSKGLHQSAGMMVNYLYGLSEIEANHEAYVGEGLVVASRAVTRIAREGKA